MASDVSNLGRLLILLGILLAVVGTALVLSPKCSWLGRLPGDVLIQRPGVTIMVPLTSCLLVSLVVSGVWWLITRFR